MGPLCQDSAARTTIASAMRQAKLVSEETEQRLRTFLTELHARGYDQTYGGPHRPRYGEGSGCSARGCAMLELAGDDLRWTPPSASASGSPKR